MNKLFIAIIAAAAVTFTSCGNKTETDAKKYMKENLMDLAKNPETFKIDDVKTVFSNDSIVVLHCKTRGQNGFGGWSSSRIEYIYSDRVIKGEEKKRSVLRNLEDDGVVSVIKEAKNKHEEVILSTESSLRESFEKECKKRGIALDSKEAEDYMITVMADIYIAFMGKDVEE